MDPIICFPGQDGSVQCEIEGLCILQCCNKYAGFIYGALTQNIKPDTNFNEPKYVGEIVDSFPSSRV